MCSGIKKRSSVNQAKAKTLPFYWKSRPTGNHFVSAVRLCAFGLVRTWCSPIYCHFGRRKPTLSIGQKQNQWLFTGCLVPLNIILFLLLPWRKNKQRARLGVVSRLSNNINFRSDVAARKPFHLVLGFPASSPDYTFILPRRKKGNILARSAHPVV